MALLSIIIILFLIMNPFGSAASFMHLMEEYTPKKQRQIILREMVLALGLMIFFSLLGEGIFWALDIKYLTVHITSGVILFLSAIKILYPSGKKGFGDLPKGDPFLVPIAVPMIAGPSLLAMVMLFSHMEPSIPMMMSGIIISWLLCSGILVISPKLYQIAGVSGLRATEKLGGILLVLISVQRMLEGVNLFLKS